MSSPSGDIAEFTILHINDVYEITPVEGGRSGGLARVATLRKRLMAEGDPVVTVISTARPRWALRAWTASGSLESRWSRS